MYQQGILTEMAALIVDDWGEDRKLRIHEGSAFAEALASPRLPRRSEWFNSYLGARIGVLLAGVVDGAYRLDTVLAAPSPAGVSVVEYHILRGMLEYTYRLFHLVQLEITVKDREKRAIEDWHSGYLQFRRISSQNQPAGFESKFVEWEPVLTAWYAELTGSSKIRTPTVRAIFDEAGMPESWWPTDRSGNAINPVYQSGYSLFSAVEHGNLWAVQSFGMGDPKAIEVDRPGLDDAASIKIQELASRWLLATYAATTQFFSPGVPASMMNKLEECRERIRGQISPE